jgi:hypothetical protein
MPMQQFSATELRSKLERAALVIPCFGYRSAMLPIFDVHGERLSLNAEAGRAAVDEDSRLLLGDGTSLANLFCIGLGTGYRLPARMGGEPNFDGQANSLWLYQNDIGEVIYRAIHRREAELAGHRRGSAPTSASARRRPCGPRCGSPCPRRRSRLRRRGRRGL